MTPERTDLRDKVVAWIRAYGKQHYPHNTWYKTAPAEELLAKWSPSEAGRVFVEMLTAARQSDESEREAERRGAFEVLTMLGQDFGPERLDADTKLFLIRHRDRYYAPLPPRACVLSDQSRVTRDALFTIWTRTWPAPDVPSRTCTDWRQLLNQPTDNGADWDKIKAFAAERGAV